MRVSRSYINQFAQYLAKVNEAAKKEIFDLDARVNFARLINEGSDYREVAHAIATICGRNQRLASALTCEFYNGIRNASKLPTKFSATVYEGFSERELRSSAMAICEDVKNGNITTPVSGEFAKLSANTNRRAVEVTVRENARRDPSKPKYAIVPQPGACAFCMMRAAQGFVYPSQASVHSHGGCGCMPTPTFGKDGSVSGYNPDEYADMWDDAAAAYDSGNLPDDLKQRIEAEKERKGASFNRTNAVLMVMRDENGLGH